MCERALRSGLKSAKTLPNLSASGQRSSARRLNSVSRVISFKRSSGVLLGLEASV